MRENQKPVPYKVVVTNRKTWDALAAGFDSIKKARTMARHFQKESGYKVGIYKWNVDDQRYLRMKR